MGTFAFTIDGTQAVMVGHALHVPVNRFPLTLPRLDSDPVRLAKVAQLVEQRLMRERLMVGGVLNRYVRVAFGLFAEFRVSVALAGTDGHDEPFAVLGLSDGADAAVFVQLGTPTDLQVTLLPDEELAAELAMILPQVPAAPGGVLHTEFADKADVSAWAQHRAHETAETNSFDTMTVQTMVRPPHDKFPTASNGGRDDHELYALLASPRLGSGRCVISARDRYGATRNAEPFGWIDTGQGRHTVHTNTDGDITTITYRPASIAAFEQTIIDTIGTVY